MSLLKKLTQVEELPPEEPILPDAVKAEIIDEVKVYIFSRFNTCIDEPVSSADTQPNVFFIQYDSELEYLTKFIDNVKNKLNPETVVFFGCDFVMSTEYNEEVIMLELSLDFA